MARVSSRTWYLLATLGLWVAALLLVVGSVLWPLGGLAPPAPSATARPAAGATAAVGLRPLDDYAARWQRRLRGPAGAAPPASTAPLTAAPPVSATDSGPVKLLGTVLEQGRDVAIFLDPAGQIALRRVGESLEGLGDTARVARIERERVTVDVAGRPWVFDVPRVGSR